MQIKNLPENERPQEKLLYLGASSLSNSELLALIIRTGGHSKSAIELAEEVISYSSEGIGTLKQIDVKELLEIKGIGITKACSIIAANELAKRYQIQPKIKKNVVHNSEDAAAMIMETLRYEKKEYLVELLLNAKGEVESKETISVGELSSTAVHPREVFSLAVRRSAAAIIIVHNHPSGDPTPSREDIAATQRLSEAAQIMGIRLLDHIIIGDGTFKSLKAEGLM